MKPSDIAEVVELEMSDSLADLTIIGSLVPNSEVWSTALNPEATEQAQIRVFMADRWLGGWPRHEWRARFDGFGAPAMRNLTQQWIVLTFARWEECHRKALIDAGDSGNADIFRDIRHLRNDIVHHGGIASAQNAGRCKILDAFPLGDPIFLEPEHFVTILDAVATWVESLGGTSHGMIVRDTKGAPDRRGSGTS